MKKSIYTVGLLMAGAMTLTSCGDPMDEITSIIYDRVFAPVDLEAKSITEGGARLQWTASSGAESYNIEVFANDSLVFDESKRVNSFSVETNEASLSGLEYDTRYSARVMAIDADDESRNSKWNTVYFRTYSQQLFESINSTQDKIDKSVVLRWTQGEENVTKIVALKEDGTVAVTHVLTQEEKTAGTATVEGLSPETTYTVKLYYTITVDGEEVDKERGSRTFTTIADLEGATVVSPEDDLNALLTNATEGQVFALSAGTFTISSEEEGKAGCAIISSSITIKGIYPTSRPVIKGRFQVQDNVLLSLSQVVMDGTDNATTDQAFVFKGTASGGLDAQNCDIKNFVKGVYYGNEATTIDQITFNNCVISGITCDGGDMFDSRKAYIKALNITNSTVYNSCATRDFIRMDDASASFSGAAPVITVQNCTFNGVANTSGKRLLYVRFDGSSISWSNTIVSNTVAVWSNQSMTPVPTFSGNVYHNTGNLNVVVEKTNLFADESGKELDPQYKDASSGDFTIGNEDVTVGDPRWISKGE